MIKAEFVELTSNVVSLGFGCDMVGVGMSKPLQTGEVLTCEVWLEELMAENLKPGRPRFTAELRQAVAATGTVFTAVAMPTRRGNIPPSLTDVIWLRSLTGCATKTGAHSEVAGFVHFYPADYGV